MEGGSGGKRTIQRKSGGREGDRIEILLGGVLGEGELRSYRNMPRIGIGTRGGYRSQKKP